MLKFFLKGTKKDMFSVTEIKTSQIVNVPGWLGETVKMELKRPSILALAARLTLRTFPM